MKQISKEYFHTYMIEKKQNSVRYFLDATKSWDYKLDASKDIVLSQNVTREILCDQR